MRNLPGGSGFSLWDTGAGDTIYYNSGKVGIGTTSPKYDLDVDGIIRTSAHLRFNQYLLNETAQAVFQNYTDDNTGFASFNFAFSMGAWAPGTKMVILSNGSIRIINLGC